MTSSFLRVPPRFPQRLSACVALLFLLGCSGRDGTISISVLSAPGSEILSQVQRLEASLVDSNNSELAHFGGRRDSDGVLTIAIDLDASAVNAKLIVEGFSAADERIAFGRVGPLPLSAVNATLAVFLAPPLSIREAPISLSEPLSHIGATFASFGVILAGGQNVDGPVDSVTVYSSYLHSSQEGLAMPVALSQPTLVAGSSGTIYMIGGTDTQQNPSNVALAFDTTAAPAGSYRALVMADQYARSGSTAAVVGQEQFIVSGDPALLLDGFQNTLRPLPGGENLTGPGHTALADNSLQVVFAGAELSSGAALFESGLIRTLSPPVEMLRTEHRGIALPSGEILFLGGAIDGVATTSAVLYKPESQSFQTISLLASPRRNPALAITDDYLVVVGGEADDGSPLPDVEIFDADTLAAVATLALVVPRKDTVAHPLNNGQVLIAGGLDSNNRPTAVLELFTPDR
ncbi:MAG: hypothetical protein JKY56_27200 [Kofleriaceae bacterium]|nr:hypothetical protein [Kofleriaceae bacterium]